MKLLVILALVAAAYGAAVENCHLSRLQTCGDPISEYRKEMGQSFPITEEQTKELCEKMEQARACAEEYQNKCMTPMQLETIGFLTEGSRSVYNDFCQEGSQIRTDYLKHASCLDEASKSEESRNQYSYIEAALEDLHEKPTVEKLTTACCGYQWIAAKSEAMGKEKCGEEAVASYKRVVDMAMSSLPNIFCSGFDPESEKCNNVMPPAGTKPKGTIRNSHVAQTFLAMYAPDLQQ